MGRGSDLPSHFHLGFFLLWTCSLTHMHTYPHTHLKLHTHTQTHTKRYRDMQEYMHIHMQHTLNAHNLFLNKRTPHSPFFILAFSSSISLFLFPVKVPLQPGQSFKFTVLETLDRIKEEFQFLQAQYHRYTHSKPYTPKLYTYTYRQYKHFETIHVCISPSGMDTHEFTS